MARRLFIPCSRCTTDIIAVGSASSESSVRCIVRLIEYCIGEPALEGRIIAVLLEEFGVVLHKPDNNSRERLVVLNAGVLLVGVLLGIAIGRIGGDALRDIFRNQLADAITVLPLNVAELFIEHQQNV